MCAVCSAFGLMLTCARCQRLVCLDFPSTPDDPERDSLCVGCVWNPLLCQRCDDARVEAEAAARWLQVLERRC